MVVQSPNTWELLYNGLATNERNKPGGEDVLKKLDELHAMAQHGSTEDFQRHVSELLDTYGASYGLSADVNGQDLLREAIAWRDQNFPTQEPQQTTEQPQEPAISPLAKFMASLNENKEKTPGGTPGGGIDTASAVVEGMQQDDIMKAFDEALKLPNDAARADAIRNVLDRLDAAELMKGQVAIIKEHIVETQEVSKIMTKQNLSKDDVGNILQEAAENRKKRFDENDTKEQREERSELDKKLYDRAHNSLLPSDPNTFNEEEARIHFKELLLHRQNQARRQYYVLEDYATPGNWDTLYELQHKLERVREMRMQRSALAQRVAQEETEQQERSQQPPGQSVRNLAQNAKGKGARQLFRGGFRQFLNKAAKEAAEKATQALLSQPEVWIPILLVLLAIFIAVAVGILILLLLLFIINQTQQSDTVPVPGVTLTLDTNPPGQTHYVNGKDINYTVDIRYSGTYSLVVTDIEPDNANIAEKNITGKYSLGSNSIVWNLDANAPLPDSTASEKHWKFNLTFSQVGTDFVFHNKVTVNYAPGSGPNGQILPAGGRFGVSPTLSPKFAGGYCSPSNLAKYFGGQKNGEIASCICKYESGGDPGVVNKACLSGRTADWSVGLFQINLDTNPQRCDGAFSRTGLTCSVRDLATLNRCSRSLMDPTNNINAAVKIYQAGHGWDSGWHAEKGKCF